MWTPTNEPSHWDLVAWTTVLSNDPVRLIRGLEPRIGWAFGYIQEYRDEKGHYMILRIETYGVIRTYNRDEIIDVQDVPVHPDHLYRAVWTVLGPVVILDARIGTCA